MTIESFELRRVLMPLRSPFRTSFGVEHERDVLLVHVVIDGVDGWGECVAGSDPLYSSEYVDAAQHVILHHLAPRLLAAGVTRAERVAETLQPVVGHRMAKAAVEMAVLDANLRARGESFADYLGVSAERIPSGVSVGIQDSIPQLLDVVGGYLDEGYARIKLKIEPGWDVAPVAAVRERFGDILLQADANAAYTLADARVLRALDAFDLLLVEQPLPEDDLRQHAELARLIRTPVCLDESIVSARAASDAIAWGAAAVVNIKPGRVGGYLEARTVHDVCRAAGVPVWCGGMLETGLGRAANIALAGLPGFVLPGDVSGSDRFYREDITEPTVMTDGTVPVYRGAGIGPEPLPERLAATTTSVESVAAGS